MLRKPARAILNVLTALSLVTLLVSIALWLGSSGSMVVVSWAKWSHGSNIESAHVVLVCGVRGRIEAGYERIEHAEPYLASLLRESTPDGANWSRIPYDRPASPFHLQRDRNLTPTLRSTLWSGRAPGWVVAAAAALLPAARIVGAGRRRRMKRARRKSGRCPACSYDLTGNASGTCPECGTAVALVKGVAP